MAANSGEITLLLQEWKDGNQYAGAKLFEVLMPQLHRIAARYFAGERNGHTLQPTALVNEAFLRMAAAKNVDWRGRGHFLALAARVMRHYLVDHARSRRAVDVLPIDGLPERMFGKHKPLELATTLDGLLDELELESPQRRAVVELKFFLGLADTEAAEALNLTLHTFQREWYRARKWLFERLTV